MSKKANRNIAKKTVRQMSLLSHYRFRERLIAKAQLYKEKHIIVTEESYTSKTCTLCGALKKLKGDKVYNCSHCGNKLDRDMNGARNILLKTVLLE
jgi:putative transposase